MNYPIDENGVPVITRDDIEQKAEDFITLFFPDTLKSAQITPTIGIVKKLIDEYKINFVFDDDLGETKSRSKILGKFRANPRSIFVDNSLDYNSPRWLFTLAHELGHLVFHRNLHVLNGGARDKMEEVVDSENEVSPKETLPKSFYDWTEWQANKFASSFLMPRLSFTNFVAEQIDKLTLTRNHGRIYLDNQPGNLRQLEQVLHPVCNLFQTSKEAVIIRMKEFGLIIDERQKSVQRIRDLLREE